MSHRAGPTYCSSRRRDHRPELVTEEPEPKKKELGPDEDLRSERGTFDQVQNHDNRLARCARALGLEGAHRQRRRRHPVVRCHRGGGQATGRSDQHMQHTHTGRERTVSSQLNCDRAPGKDKCVQRCTEDALKG